MRVFLWFAVFYVQSSAVTPVEKVIQLLKNLEQQTTEEGANEAADYDKVACFCKEQASAKLHAIEKSATKIEKLNADIEDLAAEITELNTDISKLETRIGEIEDEVKADTKTRDEEHEVYVVDEEDLSGAIDALKGAIKALQTAKHDMKGDVGRDFLQMLQPVVAVVPHLRLQDVSVDMSSKLVALVQQMSIAVPKSGKAHDSTFHSNEIIDILKGLLKTFNKNKKTLDDDEFEALSAYQMKMNNLNNEKKFKIKEKTEKTDRVNALSADKEDKTQEKNEESDAKSADEAFMAELTTQCEDKAKQWDQRSKARANELTALAEAVTILDEGVKNNYNANRKLVGFIKTEVRPVSFLQIRGAGGRVVGFLEKHAVMLRSEVLQGLVNKLNIKEDHFVKVRGLINDLISKLEADALEEADSKSFCDTEMGKATNKRDEQNLEIETQTAIVTKNQVKQQQLKDEIAELSKEIADLHKGLKEAAELRADEKAANEKTIAMATDGKAAVSSAIEVLEGFYKSSESMLQLHYKPPKSDRDGNTVGDLAPESSSLDGDYKGNQDAGKGIVGMLNVILSDFERTESTTKDQESDSAKAYEKFKSDSESDVTAKGKEKEKKEGEMNDAKDAEVQAQDDKEDAVNLRDSALHELTELKGDCVDGEETYAQRVAKREKEIEALKEALTILNDWQS